MTLEEHNRVKLLWVPGQKGIASIEFANLLAKQSLKLHSQDLHLLVASLIELSVTLKGFGGEDILNTGNHDWIKPSRSSCFRTHTGN
jgi:hypothetical protein